MPSACSNVGLCVKATRNPPVHTIIQACIGQDILLPAMNCILECTRSLKAQTSTHRMSAGPEDTSTVNLGLGLERFGYFGLQTPWRAAALVRSFLPWRCWACNRLKVDDSLSELLRTNTPEFRTYESVSERFPSSEYDVLVVVEGKSLLCAQGHRRLSQHDDRPQSGRWRQRRDLDVVGARRARQDRLCAADHPRSAARGRGLH